MTDRRTPLASINAPRRRCVPLPKESRRPPVKPFSAPCGYLAKTLAADYAFVGEMSPEHDNMIRTVAVYADGQIAQFRL